MLVDQHKVRGTLVGVNGNAFSVMGHFRRLARNQGWEKSQIDTVCNAAMKGDYTHLLNTIMDHMSMEDDDEIQ